MFERFIESEDVLIVPMTNNRYTVNIREMSVSDNGFVIAGEKDEDGELSFELKWYKGKKRYKLSEIVAHTFKPVKLPIVYWDRLKVLHKDGDVTNQHPLNLVWKYPTKLGYEDYNGFSFIPMFSRYMIDSKGVVFDLSRKRFVKGRFIKGYFTYVLFNDLEERASLSRHRAIGLVFLDYPCDVDEKHINHINGIKGEDGVENLEWVSCAENRMHAIDIGLISIRKPIVMENEVSGETRVIKSMKDACRLYGISKKVLSGYLNSEIGCYKKWPFKFSYYIEDEEADDITPKTKILVRNLRDGKITEYDSLISCARCLRISKHSVSARIEDRWDKIHSDGLQIRRKTDQRPWYTPDDVEQSILESGWITPCLVRKCSSGEVVEYSSQREACRALGISEATLHKWLSGKNQPIFKGYSGTELVQVKRVSDGNAWRIPDDYFTEYTNSIVAKEVIVRNIHTKEEILYESAVSCAKELQILTTTLNWRLKTRGQRTFNKRFQFKYRTEAMPFKE